MSTPHLMQHNSHGTSGIAYKDTLMLIPPDNSRRYSYNSNITPSSLPCRNSLSNLGSRSTRWTTQGQVNTTFSTNYQMAADLFCIGNPRNEANLNSA